MESPEKAAPFILHTPRKDTPLPLVDIERLKTSRYLATEYGPIRDSYVFVDSNGSAFYLSSREFEVTPLRGIFEAVVRNAPEVNIILATKGKAIEEIYYKGKLIKLA